MAALAAYLHDEGVTLLGVDNLPGSAPLEELVLPRRVCLLFGQEGPGLSAAAREACDGTFSIAQFGSTRSINASAAAAVAMHTWVRQHADLSDLLAWLEWCPAGPSHTAGQDRLLPDPLPDLLPSTRRTPMPIATPEVYAEMLDKAKREQFAYPAINVSSSQTLNAALAGFAEAGSDGIIQVSTGGADYLSGPTIKNMVAGSVAFATYALEVARNYPVNIALHTDHCPKDKLDGFVRPLLDISVERVKNGQDPLFQSHMWDGSAVELHENLQIAQELLEKAAAARIVLEIEVGVVGGEEDGVEGGGGDKLYSTPGDAIDTVEALGLGEKGRYLTALTFGNVHGVYKPGNVKLRPDILAKAQEAVVEKLGLEAGSKPFDLVFHGGSGSTADEIAEAVRYGVVKMNVDTDTQYAFTRPIAGHMMANYDGVLKIDGEVGNKKAYDPRAWGKAGEAGMAARVVEACENLSSTGTSVTA